MESLLIELTGKFILKIRGLIYKFKFRTCKQFNQCYSCAKLGNGQLEGTSEECIGEYTKYRFKMFEDEETGEKVFTLFYSHSKKI